VIPGPDDEQDVSFVVYNIGAGECSGYGSGYADRGWELRSNWARIIRLTCKRRLGS